MIVYGSKLYGVTQNGGTNSYGTLYSYEPSSNAFSVLLHLGNTYGKSVYGYLALYNTSLYGITNGDNNPDDGKIIEYNIATGVAAVRHTFINNEGSEAWQVGMTLVGSMFYGVMNRGGMSESGTLFSFNPASSGADAYKVVKKVEFGNPLGNEPIEMLVSTGGNELYGITANGPIPYKGIIFKYDIQQNTVEMQVGFSVLANAGNQPTSLMYYPVDHVQHIQSWDNMTKTYGETNIQLQASVSSGQPLIYTSTDPLIASVSGNFLIIHKAGVVQLTAHAAGNSYFYAADSTIQLTINKKALTVKVNNEEKCPGNPNPTFTLLYDEFAGTDDEGDLPDPPTASTTAGTEVGTFPIVVSGGSDERYSFTYINGTLTVMGASVPSAVIGKNVISVTSEAAYRIDPILSTLSYTWTYTGTGMTYMGDSIGPDFNIHATKTATPGFILCIISRCGLVDTFKKEIGINTKPSFENFLAPLTCGIYKSRCDSSYLSSLKVESMFQTPVTTCSPSGYSDYTDSETTGTLFLGEAYTLNLEAGGMPGYFGLWIDYNNDGDFGGPQELLSANFEIGFQYIVPNIVVPNVEAYKGPRRMRIKTRLSKPFSAADYCQTESEVGETEDYLISLDVRPVLEGPNFITPNADGLNDLFVIRGVNTKTKNSLLILDRMGKIIYETENYQNNWPEPHTKLNNGVYFYIFKNGEQELKSYIDISY